MSAAPPPILFSSQLLCFLATHLSSSAFLAPPIAHGLAPRSAACCSTVTQGRSSALQQDLRPPALLFSSQSPALQSRGHRCFSSPRHRCCFSSRPPALQSQGLCPRGSGHGGRAAVQHKRHCKPQILRVENAATQHCSWWRPRRYPRATTGDAATQRRSPW